ncbi:MAG: M23 family metallopeptidase [Pseudomonadota bacterium]
MASIEDTPGPFEEAVPGGDMALLSAEDIPAFAWRPRWMPPIDDALLDAAFDPASARPAPLERSVRLGKGETFGGALRDLGLAAEDIANAAEALVEHVSMKRLPVGQAMTVTLQSVEQGSSEESLLLALSIRPEPQREVTLERDAEGSFSVEERQLEVVTRTRRASGEIDDSLIGSAEAAGVPGPAVAEMLRAFAWDVNFQHDIKAGDRFDVLIEQSWTIDGHQVDPGRVLWAALTTEGGENSYSIYRFEGRDGEDSFYNEEGESVVRSLLRTPLNMSRISSGFGMRRHPVLKFTRLHAGVDFAAPPGTPILAAGAGKVVEAGRKGGYGNWVKVWHSSDLATGYAHMSRIAPGIRRGKRVRQGQVIGYVGSTGMSTGPHLHFELHRGGRPVNPLTVARSETRKRLAGSDLARFREQVAEIDRMRDRAATERLPSE